MPEHPPPQLPGWFALLRQVVVFLLGVGVILDAIWTAGTHVTELIAGLVLIGMVPLDSLMNRLPRPRKCEQCEATEYPKQGES
jgi:hypothetical protein